jgi:hypothetical protein
MEKESAPLCKKQDLVSERRAAVFKSKQIPCGLERTTRRFKIQTRPRGWGGQAGGSRMLPEKNDNKVEEKNEKMKFFKNKIIRSQ